MNINGELNTITSTLSELSTRITALVDLGDDEISGELYNELVAAERMIGALRRRLERAAGRST